MVEESVIAELNLAIQKGGEDYWRKVYFGFAPRIKRFLSRQFSTNNLPDDVFEDMASKTLLKLAEKKPVFDVEAEIWCWLCKTAMNLVRDYIESLTGQTLSSTDHNDDKLNEFVMEVEKDTEPSLAEARVNVAFEKLSQEEQTLLSMRVKGTPYEMIAIELGIKENVARVYYGRAKEKLRQLYYKLKAGKE